MGNPLGRPGHHVLQPVAQCRICGQVRRGPRDGAGRFRLLARLARARQEREWAGREADPSDADSDREHTGDPEPRQFIPQPDLAPQCESVRVRHPPGFGLDAANPEMRLRFHRRFETEERLWTMVKNYCCVVSGQASAEVIIDTSNNGFFLGERGLADQRMM